MLNKRILFLTAVFTVVVGTVAVGGAAAQSAPSESDYGDILNNMDGDGSAEDPYQVTNITQLQAFDGIYQGINSTDSANNLSPDQELYIELANDIDASGTQGWDNGFEPLTIVTNDGSVVSQGKDAGGIDNFDFSFDGQNHTIEDIYINATIPNNGAIFSGLFTTESGGSSEIKNLEITGDINSDGYSAGLIQYGSRSNEEYKNIDIRANITGKTVSGLKYFTEDTTIEDVHVTGNLTSTATAAIDSNSGLVSYAYGTGNLTIRDSSFSGTLRTNGASSTLGVGGIVAESQSVTINNVSSTGEIMVSGTTDAGVSPIIGRTFTGTQNFSDVYSGGDITGDSGDSVAVGGFAGRVNSPSINIQDSVVTMDVSGMNSSNVSTDGFPVSDPDSSSDDVYYLNNTEPSIINGTSLSQQEMWYNQQPRTMGGLEFGSTWSKNNGYPLLQNIDVKYQTGGYKIPIRSGNIQVEYNQSVVAGDTVDVNISSSGLTGTAEVEGITEGTIRLEIVDSESIETRNDPVRDTLTLTSGNSTLEWKTDSEDIGTNYLVIKSGENTVSENIVINVTSTSGTGTTFTSFDIPGTDISIPLLPVGGILVAVLVVGGYIYYREEDIEFQ